MAADNLHVEYSYFSGARHSKPISGSESLLSGAKAEGEKSSMMEYVR